jgi:ferredoxin, 2Fe-2S
MPKVTYIEYDGAEHPVEVPIGLSLMRGAVNNNVPGIDADCGGECACATCHVYVDVPWLAKIGLPVPGSQEASMLSFAAVAQPDSRLSCQITMTEELDGPRGETFDWVDRVSVELTTMMLATLFDFPCEERRKLTCWSDVAICNVNAPDAPVHSEQERFAEMKQMAETRTRR